MMMFNEEEQAKRIGDLKLSSSVQHLAEVESYFIETMAEYPTQYSHDTIALENPFFETIGYSSYAGCFIMYPLQFELSFRQIMEARGVGVSRNFCDYFESRIINNDANKYRDRKGVDTGNVEALVVLTGCNKLKKAVCPAKLMQIMDLHSNVVFKPHPITTEKAIEEMKSGLGSNAVFADKSSNLYDYLVNSEYVYTTHCSESLCYASVLGKKTGPIDKYDNRLQHGFSHINSFMFLEDNPREWIDKTFSDYRSGIVNPLIEDNWREKIHMYLEFIHDKRKKFEGSYVI